MLTDDAASVPNYEITDRFLALVEQQIYEAPEYYLWTHKRWKTIIEQKSKYPKSLYIVLLK